MESLLASWPVAPVATAGVVLVCVFGGALLGIFLRGRIPENHLSGESKDVIRIGMGLVATMAALVLGLVVAAAKSSYDTQDDAIKHAAAKIILLDRFLAIYGPETQELRDLIRRTIADRVNAVWPEGPSEHAEANLPKTIFAGQAIGIEILRLSPRDDFQRLLQSQALNVASDIGEMRWFLLGSFSSSIPAPFLVVVVLWLTVLFGSFGLFAPRNRTVIGILFLCAVSVAGSTWLILEMDQPYNGLIKVSGAPLRYVVSVLGE